MASSSLRQQERCDYVGGDNQVPASRSGFNFLRGGVFGGGKAQSSLEKIIKLIASCKATEVLDEAATRGGSVSVSKDLSCGRSELDLDLNLGMASNEVDNSTAAVRIGDGDVNVIGEKTDAAGEILVSEDGDEEEDGARDKSVDEKNRVGGGGSGGDGDGGYLSLLIEAAQLVSGQFRDDEEMGRSWRDTLGSELVRNSGGPDSDGYGLVRKSQRLQISSQKKALVSSTNTKLANNECWMMGDLYEDVSPVVKSKRGRTQVLPYRFRDSVRESLGDC